MTERIRVREKESVLTALPEDYDADKVTPMTSRMTKNTKSEEDGPSTAQVCQWPSEGSLVKAFL